MATYRAVDRDGNELGRIDKDSDAAAIGWVANGEVVGARRVDKLVSDDTYQVVWRYGGAVPGPGARHPG